MRPAPSPLIESVTNGRTGIAAPDVGECSSPADWDAYVEAHPRATGYHVWAWRAVIERGFRHPGHYLTARDGTGAICGVLPLVRFNSWLFGRFLVSLPFVNYGGILASHDAARTALLDAAVDLAGTYACRHVELRHVDRQLPRAPVKQHKVTMLLPLEGTVEAAWKRLDGKVRNQVRKAEKSGLVSTVGGTELLTEFYPVFARNMRDLGTPVYARGFFEQILAELPDRTRVFVVRKGVTPVAAGIGCVWRDTIEVPWASSLREYRQLCPNMLLYWAVITHGVEAGLRTLDFGRSTPEGGSYQFKRQWGAEPVPLHWEYWLPEGHPIPDQGPTNPKMQTAVAVWQRLPLALANTLGPYVVRVIP